MIASLNRCEFDIIDLMKLNALMDMKAAMENGGADSKANAKG